MRKFLLSADELLRNGRFISKLHLANLTFADLITALTVWGGMLYGAIAAFQISPMLGSILLWVVNVPVFVAVCGAAVDTMLSLAKRDRMLSSEVVINGELYLAITDRLKARGVSRVKQFILDHPQHYKCCMELPNLLGWSYLYEYHYSVMSLVYTGDDPVGTGDAVADILKTRGRLAVEDIEDLLRIGAEVQTPLRDGAL